MRAFILALPIAVAVLVGGGAAAPALASEAAGEETEPPGVAYCAALARQCGLACNQSTEPGSAAAAACEARCAVERAACEARDGLSRLEPWLADKADKVDRFMEGFHGDDQGPADGPDAPQSVQSCRESHEACETRCADRYGADEYGRAGCKSQCALDRATCEANAGVEAARPFIERETERLRDFFEGFLGEGEDPPPPPEWPPTNPDGTVDL